MLGIFLDTETNGLHPGRHRVIEIALRFVDLTSGESKGIYESVVFQPLEIWEKSDPESLQVNGFTWELVSQGKKENAVANDIKHLFAEKDVQRGRAVFICQNPSFDRIFFSQLIDPDIQEDLEWPYHWLDLASMYWATSIIKAPIEKTLFPWETGVSKDKIAMTFKLPKEKKPHRAMNGVDHLLLCYQAVVGFPKNNLKIFTLQRSE